MGNSAGLAPRRILPATAPACSRCFGDAAVLQRPVSNSPPAGGTQDFGSCAPSRTEAWPDKIAVLTLGGGNGAGIRNGWQDKSGADAQEKDRKGPKPCQTQAPRRANRGSSETFVGFASWQGAE